MVDRPLVERKIVQLKERKTTLQQYQLRRYRDFLKGPYPKAVEKILQEMVEICIDIGKHIIADELFPVANDSKEVFRILADRRVVPASMLSTMENMVGFRNVIVHLYDKVDPHEVYNIYDRHLSDFDRFAQAVRRFMDRRKK